MLSKPLLKVAVSLLVAAGAAALGGFACSCSDGFFVLCCVAEIALSNLLNPLSDSPASCKPFRKFAGISIFSFFVLVAPDLAVEAFNSFTRVLSSTAIEFKLFSIGVNLLRSSVLFMLNT